MGAVLILIGIACLVIQLAVSIRDRRKAVDVTGDPYDGRTLEWATSSPPPPYNFAVLPEVRDREPLVDMKERGVAYERPRAYEDIEMPKNSRRRRRAGRAGLRAGLRHGLAHLVAGDRLRACHVGDAGVARVR